MIIIVTDLVKRFGGNVAAVAAAERLRQSGSRAARWVASGATWSGASTIRMARRSGYDERLP